MFYCLGRLLSLSCASRDGDFRHAPGPSRQGQGLASQLGLASCSAASRVAAADRLPLSRGGTSMELASYLGLASWSAASRVAAVHDNALLHITTHHAETDHKTAHVCIEMHCDATHMYALHCIALHRIAIRCITRLTPLQTTAQNNVIRRTTM